MPHRIKIIFSRVHVINSGDAGNSGNYYFDASIGGQTVGNREVFDAIEGRHFDLDVNRWSRVVDVGLPAYSAGVDISFQAWDEDTFVDDRLGAAIRDTIRPPWSQRSLRYPTSYFILEGRVELEIGGRFGAHPGDAVFICRQESGSASYNTVGGVARRLRLEVHPVLPLPATGLPPWPGRTAPGPPPAAGLGGATAPTAAHWTGTPAIGAAPAVPAEPNIFPNPPVIPILDAADATVRTAARIEVTYYRPGELNFALDDARLVWSQQSVSGGAQVAFVGQPRGRRVFVYGTRAGQVRLEVRFEGALVAQYRAIVREIRTLRCRFNILNGPNAASQPTARPQDILRHVALANLFLRQIGLELVRDTNHSVNNGARIARDGGNIIDGIFRISVAQGWTRQMNGNAQNRSVRLNYRNAPTGQPPVLNFAYVHSDEDGALGAACYYPDSKLAVGLAAGARPRIRDSGSPSSSWVTSTNSASVTGGSGVPPDAAAGTATMDLISRRHPTNHARLFGMYVSGDCGDATDPANDELYGLVVTHELGHILNLGHRVEGPDAAEPSGLVADGIFFDGLTYPDPENIMRWGIAANINQDFDILQALAVWESPLVNP
jgi:hypothetical protein